MSVRWLAVLALALAGCAVHREAAVRVAFDADGVRQVHATGVADRRTGRRVTADDPVRVASVSKLVVALAVMRLVEAGRLDLDADVGATLGVAARNPAYPAAPVTLRQLLSHRAGLRDELDPVLPLSARLADWLADRRAWDAGHPPGAFFHYANANLPVVAAVLERTEGERFDRLMARLVFVPLGIEACFNWTTCRPETIARAVVLYGADGAVRRDDLGGAAPACPVALAPGDACDLRRWRAGENGALFSPQGGLRISARGLARLGAMLLRGGDGFLRPASIRMLGEPAWVWNGRSGMEANGDTEGGFFCRYGLAMQQLATPTPSCRDDLWGDGRPRLGHAGEAYGLRAGLWLDRERRQGVAYFVTAVPDAADGHGRRSAFTRAEERLARGR